MIERQFVIQKKKEFEIEQFITQNLKRVGLSHIKIQRTPLGEKIMLFTSKPGLVVGRAGQNIKNLTEQLKKRFNLENPQIEINEVKDINLNPNIVAERIASALERYGSKRFKAIIHRALDQTEKKEESEEKEKKRETKQETRAVKKLKKQKTRKVKTKTSKTKRKLKK